MRAHAVNWFFNLMNIAAAALCLHSVPFHIIRYIAFSWPFVNNFIVSAMQTMRIAVAMTRISDDRVGEVKSIMMAIFLVC